MLGKVKENPTLQKTQGGAVVTTTLCSAQFPEQKRQDTTFRWLCQVVFYLFCISESKVSRTYRALLFAVKFSNNSCFAELIGDYSLYAIFLRVEVKRTVSDIFKFHNRHEYRINGEPCQPIKKNFLLLTSV